MAVSPVARTMAVGLRRGQSLDELFDLWRRAMAKAPCNRNDTAHPLHVARLNRPQDISAHSGKAALGVLLNALPCVGERLLLDASSRAVIDARLQPLLSWPIVLLPAIMRAVGAMLFTATMITK